MVEVRPNGSGWLGDIPQEWTINRIGDFYKVRNVKVNDLDYKPLSVTMKGIVPQLETAVISNDHNNRKLVLKGDFVINSRSDRRGSCGISDYEGSVSLINTVLAPIGEMNPNYYNWLFHTEQFADEFYKWGHGIVDDLWTTKWQEMKSILIVAPPIDEQQKIAAYLELRCAKIDEIIEEAKKSIEEYKDLKQSVISGATTRGVRKNRVMKNSGLDWLPDIPDEWNVIPAKALFYQSNERMHPGDVQLTASQKYGIISQTEYMEREQSRIVVATQGIENWKHVEPGDFVISLRSFQGGLERSNVTGCITWHYIVLKPRKDIHSNYFKWLFKSDKYINALQSTANFIRDGQDLRFSNFVKVPLIDIPIKEQEEIAEYIDKEVPKLEALIEEKQSLIEDLEAYKKSLIYEVVTGKRKVV